MENFDKSYSPKRSEYRNCESCGGAGCPDCYGFGFSMERPEFDKAKEEYLNLIGSTTNIGRIRELELEFPELKGLGDLRENKLTTMEKKLITEMKFMMERLESPRLTYTEYEKKHKLLTEDSEMDRLSREERRKRSQAGIEDKKPPRNYNLYVDDRCVSISAPKSQVKEFNVSIKCDSSLLGDFTMDIENKEILGGDGSVTFDELVGALKEIKLTLVGGETNAYDKLIDLIGQGWGTTKF